MTIRNKDLIQAVLDGKTVEYSYGGDHVDVWFPAKGDHAIRILSDGNSLIRRFRLKPEPLVVKVTLFPNGSIEVTRPLGSMKFPTTVGLELDPETLEVLSATTEAP